MRLHCLLALVVPLTSLVCANTEKTVFLAPSSITVPNVHPGLDDLCLDVITPHSSVLHAQLPVAFPSSEYPQGTQSWYLLDQLQPGQRYEVRVCWVATPTEFWLDTFPLTQVFDSPHLISPLAQYSDKRQDLSCQKRLQSDPTAASKRTSVLFLRINSAADFYTLNKTLMSKPPAVGVDIILDPFIFNVLPRSLLPTGAYILVVALGSWTLSGMIWNWLRGITQEGVGKAHVD